MSKSSKSHKQKQVQPEISAQDAAILELDECAFVGQTLVDGISSLHKSHRISPERWQMYLFALEYLAGRWFHASQQAIRIIQDNE